MHISRNIDATGLIGIGAVLGLVLLAGSTAVALPTVYVGAVFVAMAFVVGPSVTLGGAAGVVVHGLFRGAVGPWTAELVVWMLAFAGLLAWLDGNDAGYSMSTPARGLWADLLACGVAGMYATATAAWLATLLGSERFYTAVVGFLPGLLVVTVLGALVGGWLRTVVLPSFQPDAEYESKPAKTDGGIDRAASPDRRRGVVLLGLLAVGLLWIGGAMGLDVLTHDLALFGSETELRNYASDFFGTGTAVATVGANVLVGVYQHGGLLVRLSPLLLCGVILGLRWLVSRHRPPDQGTAVIDLGSSDD